MKNITSSVLTICFAVFTTSISSFAGSKVAAKTSTHSLPTTLSFFDYACGRTTLYDEKGFKIGEVTIYCDNGGVTRMAVKMCEQ